MKIPFISPVFPKPEELVGDLKRIYENNYYSNNGPVYVGFQAALESYLGEDTKVVIVANATLGLMMSITASIKSSPGEKKYIAVPSFTFAAGPLAIKWCGFEPVFFDVDVKTAQPSMDSFQNLLGKYSDELAGVLLVNNFGIGNANIDRWEKVLSDQNLPLIIDSAPGFGSTYSDGSLIGRKGQCEVFSFHATKPFAIGEGGLITTKSEELATTLESIKNFGFNTDKETIHQGINAKITELDCAIGIHTLKRYPKTLASRRATYRRYESNLKARGIEFLPRADSAAIQFATILVDPKKRHKLMRGLEKAEIEARTYYAPPVHTFPFFAGMERVNLSNTNELSKKVLSLPVHPHMEPAVVDYISEVILQSLQE